MHNTTREILDIQSAIESLTSLAPGNGYDMIGRALSELSMQPADIAFSDAILKEAEKISPNIISRIQKASIESEIELELFHAEKMFDQKYDSQESHDHLFQDYQYDWFTGRSALEATFIPEKSDKLPLICYLGISGIPFSALSLQRRKNSNALWFDKNKKTKTYAEDILTRLDVSSIEMKDFDLSLIKSELAMKVPDYTTILDVDLISKELLEILRDLNIDNISVVTSHGFNELLYPKAPMELIQQYFTFEKGYYPERITGMTDNDWISTSALSYVSLALFKKSF